MTSVIMPHPPSLLIIISSAKYMLMGCNEIILQRREESARRGTGILVLFILSPVTILRG